ncbi:MAG: chorismate synthase [Deltaproteobacteria bacterium]|nr:chorismate synthase [Deltaproteobacteria bacterium]MBW1819401.1 chorismate synthase [Deltaproteobacteria bacterium]MBW2285473.1 chorismate synthase [Deltaproteobacteria bacterium]
MPGNSFGALFRITTFGESHGEAIGAVIDGCPPRLPLAGEDFTRDMARRRPGKGPADTPRREADRVEILSGVFEGRTTGTPIALLVRNRDADSRPYEILRSLFRPGHADYAYHKRYGHFDFRGGGRYSARETACRVAAGVVAGKVLAPLGVNITAVTVELGGISAERMDLETIEKSPVCCPDPTASEKMVAALARAREEGDSLGGIVEVRIAGCPAGLGEPIFDKLDADLAKAMMSIGTVKGVEIGAGIAAARLKGSENNDPIGADGFASNNAGGILGGISNGDDIVLRVAMKPIPSIFKKQHTIDREGRPATLEFRGRFDVCAIPRVIPVLEAMAKIVLADHYLRLKAVS